MIQFKIYNDDKIRRWSNFPTMKDPYALENTLLRIINELFFSMGLPQEKEFSILNPRIANLFFVYYTSSNFYSWGELPMSYIYNDMIRHIQNRNTSNNFTFTLESIYLDNDSSYKSRYDVSGEITIPANNLAYDIASSYVTENYLNSYNYIINNNNGILIAMIPTGKGIMTYILSVGFDPMSMSKWFCTKQSLNDPNSIAYSRYISLKGISQMKLGIQSNSSYTSMMQASMDTSIEFECSDSRIRENIENCNKLVMEYDISQLRKKSLYDTEVKYGNYPIDYNILSVYDIATPATYCEHINRKQERYMLNKFNQPNDYRIDYRVLKKQSDIIKIAEKRKEIGVD